MIGNRGTRGPLATTLTAGEVVSVKEPSSGSSSTIGFTVGFTILVILAVAVAEHEATLVNTMGIAVVAAACS